jgi:hypothetical protein
VLTELVAADPLHGCSPFKNAEELRGAVVLVARGMCAFEVKALAAVAAGASAVVVINTGDLDKAPRMSAATKAGKALVTPTVMIAQQDGEYVQSFLQRHAPHKSGLMMLVHHWDAWEDYHMRSHHRFRCLPQIGFQPAPARATGAMAMAGGAQHEGRERRVQQQHEGRERQHWCSEGHRSSGRCYAVVVASPRWYYQRRGGGQREQNMRGVPYNMRGPFDHVEAFREVQHGLRSVSIVQCSVSIAQCSVSIAQCSVSIAQCSVSIVQCRMAIAQCSVSIVQCRMAIAQC